MSATEKLDLIKGEFARMLAGGQFQENFWHMLYEPSRSEMNKARRARDAGLIELTTRANELARTTAAGDVKGQRAVRKAREKARKFKGRMRAREWHRVTDEILLEWQVTVQWIAFARDACVYIQRMNNSLRLQRPSNPALLDIFVNGRMG